MTRSKTRGPAKLDALRQAGTMHPHPQMVTDPLFQDQPFFDARDLMQVKYELLRKVEVDGAPVSTAVTAFGLARPSYYQARSAFEDGGLAGLAPRSGRERLFPRGSLVPLGLQEALRFDGRFAAGSGGGDGLAIDAILHVAGVEYALDVGPRAAAADDVAL
jgi:hypothetical protein